MGPGPEESALGQPCTESKGKSKKLPPCVDDDEDEEEGEKLVPCAPFEPLKRRSPIESNASILVSGRKLCGGV